MKLRLIPLLIALAVLTAIVPARAQQPLPLPPPLTSYAPMNEALTIEGIDFSIQRVDFWDGAIVFVATATSTGEYECFARTDFQVHMDNRAYEMPSRPRWVREAYGVNSPGTGFFTECVSRNDTRLMALPFEIPSFDGGAVTFLYEGQRFDFDQPLSILAAAAVTPVPTSAPTPTPTRTPTAAPTVVDPATPTSPPATTEPAAPQPNGATANRNANLRAGPSTEYAIVGGVVAGESLTVVATNAALDWYQLASGVWIAAFLVNDAPANLPVVNIATPPTATPAPTVPTANTQGTPAQVTNIVDGDTIDVRVDGVEYRVRYILMNTPERGEPYFTEATNANAALVAGKTVYLVKDVSETDRYGRLLRYVYLADGTFVNAELVRQGYAQLATFPPDVAQEATIRTAQQEAVNAQRGLWAVTQPIAEPPPPTPTTPPTTPDSGQQCDPAYPDVCIPPYALVGDLDCGDVPQYARFRVLPPDPHGFDGRDNDGWGCESN